MSHGIARTSRVRTDEERQKDLEKIANYRQLEDEIRTLLKTEAEPFTSSNLFNLTTKLLRLNPEYYTIWNVRRRCLVSGSWCKGWTPSATTTSPLFTTTTHDPADPDPQTPESTNSPNEAPTPTGLSDADLAVATTTLQAELTFTIPLLLEFPKCYWLWNHRSFVLTLATTLLPPRAARAIWTAELALASKMLAKDRRNFHAWGYRARVVAVLESPRLHGASHAEPELDYTARMIRQDLSNFSAWHRRTGLVLRVLAERRADAPARRHFLDQEFALVGEALNVGPEDQSLWYYHQFLVGQTVDSSGTGRTIAPEMAREERRAVLEREVEQIRDLEEDYGGVKWIYEALLEYGMVLHGLRTEDRDELKADITVWLGKLRKLDPMRKGRWDDTKKKLDAL